MHPYRIRGFAWEGLRMAFIEWNSALDVGIGDFNDQHKELCALLNKLFDAMHQGKGREVIGAVLSGLGDYTVYHFSAEEKRFAEFAYPNAAAHKAEHDDFVRRVDELRRKYDAGSFTVTVEALDFIKKWISDHIMKADKAYAAFFQSKGLS
jgi:hemerythrin